MWAHPGKQLLFMGQEFGQGTEWSEELGLDWDQLDDGYTGRLRRGIAKMVTDLNTVYRARPALWTLDTSPGGYSWIDANDTANNVLSFLRYGTDGSVIACLFNFSGSPQSHYRVGLPQPGRWIEILNTDAEIYNGSGMGNFGAVTATDTSWHGRPASAQVALAPNSAIWLTPES